MTENDRPKSRRKRSWLGPLWLQVLVAMVLGAVVGALFPHGAAMLKPLGDGFIRLISMTLAPVIFLSVALGIAHMGDLKEVGRVGIKALLYFEVVSTIALVMGLVAIDTLHPGNGMNVNASALSPQAVSGYTTMAQNRGGAVDFLLNMIPTSMVGAFTGGNMLQVVLLGVLFGLALARFNETAKPLVDLLQLLLRAVFGVVGFIMALAPIGAFGAMAFSVGQYGLGSLRQLVVFTVEVWIVAAVFVVAVLGPIMRLAGFSLYRLLVYFRDELLVAAGTASSEAVLAPLMRKLEELGCDKAVVGMVVPAGYAFNACGTAIYLSMGAIFIAQATGTHLTLADQITVLMVLMLTSKGSAGVAGAGFVTLAATLATMPQIPVAGLVLLLGVERLINAARSVVNVIGNGVATIVVAKWEHAFDADLAAQTL
ncbi:MAG: C4-dicarboxylate transporter DctA, partial [Rhodoferax sp.]|nr:C4-dicarboxylate transporter DctA [Rhodoferax sp.]